MTTKEAQSEAPSVEKLLLSVDEDWSICTGDGKCTDKGALYDCDLDQHVMNSDQVKALEAKINRLIERARSNELQRILNHPKTIVQMVEYTDPEYDFAEVRMPQKYLVDRIKALSNNLSKGDDYKITEVKPWKDKVKDTDSLTGSDISITEIFEDKDNG